MHHIDEGFMNYGKTHQFLSHLVSPLMNHSSAPKHYILRIVYSIEAQLSFGA
jgi:hypothetical protein